MNRCSEPGTWPAAQAKLPDPHVVAWKGRHPNPGRLKVGCRVRKHSWERTHSIAPSTFPQIVGLDSFMPKIMQSYQEPV